MTRVLHAASLAFALSTVSGAPAPESGAGVKETPRVASRSSSITAPASAKPTGVVYASDAEAVARAKQTVADCRTKFAEVRDYTCTFIKRERIEGALIAPHVMNMKARTNPASIYFKFQHPNKGREAIHVAGKFGGKLLAHDVGIGKFLAGTMKLDPTGSMAMEDCRHPITEAGIAALIDTVARRWDVELSAGESLVAFNNQIRVGQHPCTMIETVHPARGPKFMFHKVLLYVDQEHGLPIRFEAYDWPKTPGAAPDLVEEYTYNDLKINTGLTERDFNPDNAAYSFGRF